MSRQGVPYPHAVYLRVVDSEMNDVPADGATMGEMVMRGNNLMRGYYNDPAATAKAFEGGWFHSGDVGVMHPDGYIELRDRSKDIIISGGENISTIEVENTIVRHPAVMECAVVSMPHEKWGEVPEGVRHAAPRREGDGGRHHRVHQGAARRLQVPQGRRVRRPAQDRHRQDPEVQAAREGVGREGQGDHGRGVQGRVDWARVTRLALLVLLSTLTTGCVVVGFGVYPEASGPGIESTGHCSTAVTTPDLQAGIELKGYAPALIFFGPLVPVIPASGFLSPASGWRSWSP